MNIMSANETDVINTMGKICSGQLNQTWRKEVGNYITLHNEELADSYRSPSVLIIVKYKNT
jgi:hypothetical protein